MSIETEKVGNEKHLNSNKKEKKKMIYHHIHKHPKSDPILSHLHPV
jgi:hypothetical protein